MKAVKFIFGADLRGNHLMLRRQLTAAKISDELDVDEAFVFINRAQDKIKTLSWNGVMSYARMDDSSRKIDMNTLAEFAKAFDGRGRFDYDQALKESLIKRLGRKYAYEKPEVIGA